MNNVAQALAFSGLLNTGRQLQMIEFSQFLVMFVVIGLSFFGIGITERSRVIIQVGRRVAKAPATILLVSCSTLLGCIAIAGVLHEPLPRIHDEFSYVLMSNTFASGHVSNSSPAFPEFFDTFHVLVRPVYASKYFPAQGIFLALGERLTGHAAVGLWLTSALACAATCWMLQAWISPIWGLLGGLLMVIQFGIYSYWSQTYWGGMVAALGGALFFGAVRRLWDQLSWGVALLGAVGLVILANSRPLEGAIAVLPASCLFLRRIWQYAQWRQTGFWKNLILPGGTVLLLGAAATGMYNRAITGSALIPPYLLHEQQYQETPQFVFLPLRPKLTYSSEWVRFYYETSEMRLYLSQRTARNVMITAARKLTNWWAFYCGILLSAPLVVAGLLRRGWIRYAQVAVLAGFLVTAVVYSPRSLPPRIAIDVLTVLQITLLWFVFNDFWPRLAIVTGALVMFQCLFVKYFFPHYFAPAACLVLYLQVEALRRLWHWRSEASSISPRANRSERRRATRRAQTRPIASVTRWRAMVIWLPVACALSLVLRVEERINGWSEDAHGPDRGTLLLDDWSLKRAEIENWLVEQPGPQLVFVRYWPNHPVNFEWVYNRADLAHTKVIWARDLGKEHNRLLLQQCPDRTPWLVVADRPEPQLIPYAVAPEPPKVIPPVSTSRTEDERADQ